MKLILVRHGQTECNRDGILQGQEIDRSLNETGRAQIAETAKLLPEDIGRIISSPLKRAAETAAIINERFGLPIEFRPELMELSYGSLAGKTWEQNKEETGLSGALEKEKEIGVTFDYHIYGGESGEDLKKRVKRCIEEILIYAEKTILITHDTRGGHRCDVHTLFRSRAQGEP